MIKSLLRMLNDLSGVGMDGISAARIIDISAVRTYHTKRDIDILLAVAKEYRFINVHVLPCWVAYAANQLLNDVDILVGSPVGFPSGGHTFEVKLFEAKQLISDGVGEMDLVMNIGRFKNGDYEYVLKELREIRRISIGIPMKVIIEINCLTQTEMIRACDLVIESGADYIKSGTGWIEGGANIKELELIKRHVGDRIRIKAAGGIRTVSQFLQLRDIGIERFGINDKTAKQIIRELDARTGVKS